MTFTWRQFKQLRASYGREFEKVMGKFSDKAIAVGRPQKGQRRVDGEGCIVIAEHDFTCGPPALILPPVRKITVTDVIFRATGETRGPKHFEWYRQGGTFIMAHEKHDRLIAPIYTRHEETREIEVDE